MKLLASEFLFRRLSGCVCFEGDLGKRRDHEATCQLMRSF
ncbi:rCG56976, isoform CRA_a [Rattus norvegicus]|uniref:RCG56976, isoform CRA_a n=1 Tax=Rattus norvegicus TaxID=10116 RepID=A6JD51_RAT|nr:rCG56976, isoform CRA_a [Rattus norvegicus]